MSGRLRIEEKRITLRIEESLWAAIQEAAWREHMSVNEYIVRALQADTSKPTARIIEHGN